MVQKRIKDTEIKDELKDIGKDFQSLGKNATTLTRLMGDRLKEGAANNVERIKTRSNKALHSLENNVRERPRKSLFLSFAGGLLAGVLLRRQER